MIFCVVSNLCLRGVKICIQPELSFKIIESKYNNYFAVKLLDCEVEVYWYVETEGIDKR